MQSHHFVRENIHSNLFDSLEMINLYIIFDHGQLSFGTKLMIVTSTKTSRHMTKQNIITMTFREGIYSELILWLYIMKKMFSLQ